MTFFSRSLFALLLNTMTSPERAIIEVTIPMDLFDDSDDGEDESCPICMHSFCESAHTSGCPRQMCKVSCCRQYICAGCLSQPAKRCRCQASCKQIVLTCPFCRDMAPVDVLSMFCSKAKLCTSCEKCTMDVSNSM